MVDLLADLGRARHVVGRGGTAAHSPASSTVHTARVSDLRYGGGCASAVFKWVHRTHGGGHTPRGEGSDRMNAAAQQCAQQTEVSLHSGSAASISIPIESDSTSESMVSAEHNGATCIIGMLLLIENESDAFCLSESYFCGWLARTRRATCAAASSASATSRICWTSRACRCPSSRRSAAAWQLICINFIGPLPRAGTMR